MNRLRLICLPALTMAIAWTAAGNLVLGEDLFPDKNLEAVVRKYVFEKRNNEEPLTEKDVENISTIEGKGKGIKSLDGLEKCRALALLDLESNEITDATPIKDLKHLQSLNLANNKITDVGPLAGLAGLQYLHLAGNQITDLQPLAKLEAMRSLYLSENKVTDLGPLSGLTKLWSLELDGNQITDLKPIAKLTGIDRLHLENNQVTDLQPLSAYTELRWLLLDNNKVSDLNALIAMAKKDREGSQRFAPFCNIYLQGNPLSGDAGKQQLAELRKLVKKVDFE